jgi:uncharacterized membrane protein SpoIIM required for sporulation
MPFTKISSTHNRLYAQFSGTTVLGPSDELFGGLSANPNTFQFTKGFVSAGATVVVSFLGAGITFGLPQGFVKLDNGGFSLGGFSGCTGISVVCSGGNAFLEFKGIPTTRTENYFSIVD